MDARPVLEAHGDTALVADLDADRGGLAVLLDGLRVLAQPLVRDAHRVQNVRASLLVAELRHQGQRAHQWIGQRLARVARQDHVAAQQEPGPGIPLVELGDLPQCRDRLGHRALARLGGGEVDERLSCRWDTAAPAPRRPSPPRRARRAEARDAPAAATPAGSLAEPKRFDGRLRGRHRLVVVAQRLVGLAEAFGAAANWGSAATARSKARRPPRSPRRVTARGLPDTRPRPRATVLCTGRRGCIRQPSSPSSTRSRSAG